MKENLLEEISTAKDRLQQEDFRGCRHLFSNSNSIKVGTTYEDLFSEGFRDYILTANKILDLGAGSGQAGAELSQIRSDQIAFHAATYFDRSDTAQRLSAIYDRVFYGDVSEGSVKDSGYTAIMDAYGAFAYTWNISGLLEVVGRLLARGGRYYTVYDRVLHRWGDHSDTDHLLSNFQIVDGYGDDVTPKWFESIKGLRLLSGIADEKRYREFMEFFTCEHADFLQKGEYVFSKSKIEEINVFIPLVFERTEENVVVPPLKIYQYQDGRPSARSFLWE